MSQETKELKQNIESKTKADSQTYSTQRKLVAIDFDGTLHNCSAHDSQKKKLSNMRNPLIHSLVFNKFQDEGHRVCIASYYDSVSEDKAPYISIERLYEELTEKTVSFEDFSKELIGKTADQITVEILEILLKNIGNIEQEHRIETKEIEQEFSDERNKIEKKYEEKNSAEDQAARNSELSKNESDKKARICESFDKMASARENGRHGDYGRIEVGSEVFIELIIKSLALNKSRSIKDLFGHDLLERLKAVYQNNIDAHDLRLQHGKNWVNGNHFNTEDERKAAIEQEVKECANRRSVAERRLELLMKDNIEIESEDQTIFLGQLRSMFEGYANTRLTHTIGDVEYIRDILKKGMPYLKSSETIPIVAFFPDFDNYGDMVKKLGKQLKVDLKTGTKAQGFGKNAHILGSPGFFGRRQMPHGDFHFMPARKGLLEIFNEGCKDADKIDLKNDTDQRHRVCLLDDDSNNLYHSEALKIRTIHCPEKDNDYLVELIEFAGITIEDLEQARKWGVENQAGTEINIIDTLIQFLKNKLNQTTESKLISDSNAASKDDSESRTIDSSDQSDQTAVSEDSEALLAGKPMLSQFNAAVEQLVDSKGVKPTVEEELAAAELTDEQSKVPIL